MRGSILKPHGTLVASAPKKARSRATLSLHVRIADACFEDPRRRSSGTRCVHVSFMCVVVFGPRSVDVYVGRPTVSARVVAGAG